ncbi:hypothetical protein [Pinisolibacter sp.]|uniref:hypothetical protein n=1 Tax=Pinisolibacter sp. TaxID=2172024 RepID=UPI002FDCB306
MERLKFTAVRLPGVATPAVVSPFSFFLKPVGPRVQRAAFDGEHIFDRSAYLVFTLYSPVAKGMKADIINGDVGFPSVHLVNSNNSVFRFSRGNLKDFFDISRAGEPQEIRLPLSAFIYDRDLRTNIPVEGDFFDAGIVRIYFDFLADTENDVDIRLEDLAICPGSDDHSLNVQDLVVFERMNQSRSFPKFSTQSHEMAFSISLSAVGLAVGAIGGKLAIEVLADAVTVDSFSCILKEEHLSGALKLPRVGSYLVSATVTSPAGDVLARSRWPVVRCLPMDEDGWGDVLGMSDEQHYELIAACGGAWDRFVLSLQKVIRVGDRFRFTRGVGLMPSLPPGIGRKRVLAVFGMPRWLSRRSDLPDYYRYGPADWDEYRRLIGWIGERAVRAGITHYEVWNEATALGHWNDDFDVLMRMHRIVRETFAEVAPSLTIIGGCTHSWHFDFIEKFLVAGGHETCDGLAIHGYTYQPEDYVRFFDRMERLVEAHVPAERDFGIHITELGFRYPVFSLDSQADWLMLFTLEAASRKRYEAVLWFRFANPRVEITSGYRQSSATGYALVGNAESYCRPALVAYSITNYLLATADRVVAEGQADQRCYRFYRGDELFAMVHRDRGRLEGELPKGWRLFDLQRLETAGTALGISIRPGFHQAG